MNHRVAQDGIISVILDPDEMDVAGTIDLEVE